MEPEDPEPTDSKPAPRTVIDPNVINIGIVGASGSGKSYFFEHSIFTEIRKSIMIWDIKNQYGHLKKEGFLQYEIVKSRNLVKSYNDIINGLRFKFQRARQHVYIRIVPEDVIQGEFDPIMRHWTELCNTVTVLEEAHMFKLSLVRPFREFEKTMRLRTGKHNKNSNVIWISQLPNDMPRPIYSNTQCLVLFKHWDNVLETLETNKTIPPGVEFIEIGTKPDGEPLYNHHVIKR